MKSGTFGTYESPDRVKDMTLYLRSVFSSQEYSDITLEFRDALSSQLLTSVRAHKIILLSSGSSFFRDRITPEENVLPVPVISGSGSLWKRVIGFLYDGNIAYTERELSELRRASHLLEIEFPGLSTKKLDWRCIYCLTDFQNAPNLESHCKKVHESDVNALCKICSCNIRDLNSLQKHDCSDVKLEIKEEEPWSSEELLFVPEALSEDEGKERRRKRIVRDGGEKDNGNKSVHRQTLKRTSKICTAKRGIPLKQRNGGSGSRSLNVNHKKYLCSICGRYLTGLTAYKRHQVTHTGARPFPCDICGKAFTQNQRLTVHKRTHTGERPFMCSFCGSTFTESCKLTRHLTRVHKVNKDGSSLAPKIEESFIRSEVHSTKTPSEIECSFAQTSNYNKDVKLEILSSEKCQPG